MTLGKAGAFSVVIPVYNGGARFKRCLQSVIALDPAPLEIIVVVDGSTDTSLATAQIAGAKTLVSIQRQGPAHARNLGAKAAQGEFLFFVDADVELHPHSCSRILQKFRNQPELVALFGSYDDSPSEKDLISQFRNLLHHYIHQSTQSEVTTFWAGCGVIKREIFLKVGGFDENIRSSSIEDIEFGYRLHAQGYHIRLAKDLTVKHLKKWSLLNLIRTDIFNRAWPWTKLLLYRNKLNYSELNINPNARLSIATLATFLLLLPFVHGWLQLALVLSLMVTTLFLLNWKFYRFLLTKRGTTFCIGAIPMHWVYVGCSGLGFAGGFFTFYLNKLQLRSEKLWDFLSTKSLWYRKNCIENDSNN